MAGTREGGLKCAATNKERYGASFYVTIGKAGGKKSKGGGFTNSEAAREAAMRSAEVRRQKRDS